MQSLAVWMGAFASEATATAKTTVRYTEEFVLTSEQAAATVDLSRTPKAKTKVRFLNLTTGKRGQLDAEEKAVTIGASGVEGDRLRFFYDIELDNESTDSVYEVTIDAAHFPGTYKIYGDTIIRNQNGHDSPFQFIIDRAKVASEVSFSMEAAGDPAVDFSYAAVKAA